MVKYTLFSLLSALSTSLILCCSAVQAKAPAASPKASTELICHTQHASECYPAIFQAAEHFQIVHNDQSIPPGLHVRMNLATGLKEARLNIHDSEDLPTADLVIIDDMAVPSKPEREIEKARDESIRLQSIHDQSHQDRGYDFVPPSFDPEESSIFASSMFRLHSSSLPTLEILSTITDLVHSYDWGLALAQDSSAIQKLVSTLQPPPASEVPLEIRSAAALLLGTALQNNPEALAVLLSHSNPTEANHSCIPMHAILSILNLPTEVAQFTSKILLHQRTLFLLHQLANSLSQLRVFASLDGLTTLHNLFTFPRTRAGKTYDPLNSLQIRPGEDGRDKVRQRIANLMLDHILPALEGAEGTAFATELLRESKNEESQHQGARKEIVKVLEPWNQAFRAALRQYDVYMERKVEANEPVVYKARSSIWEATLLLKKILDMD